MAPRVPVAPEVLEWAADQAGLDQGAIHETFPKWDEWITGERQPTLNQLEKLANTAGVPFGYLLMDTPPTLELPIPDFREGFDGAIDEPSSDLMAVINQSIRRQEWYSGYAQDSSFPAVPLVGAGETLSVVDAAATLRDALVFQVERRRTGSWDDARKRLIQRFEELGGLTVVTSMVDNNTRRLLNLNEFRGFTLIDQYAPLVFVNARQTINGQIFTLAHEFAHVLRGVSGISLEDPAWEAQSDVERWCNDVASEFLVPAADLATRYPTVARYALSDKLDRLAQIYKCGTLVILQAIRRHGFMEFADFDSVYQEEVRRLEHFAQQAADSGGGNFYYSQPFRIGERLSRALINDALEGRTTFSEAMRLMAIRSLSSFDKYARHLGIT